ncbi:MAG: TonB family protein [Acidobacteria bacterium]|nr:TonB family protein [Acidobacteriota bacterium]
MADIDTLPPPPSNKIDADRTPLASKSVVDDVHLSGEIKEDGVFTTLLSNLRDAFFPPDLPPLVLESKPIAVADPMATKRSSASTAVAVVLHIAIILLIALFVAREVHVAAVPPKAEVVTIEAPPPPTPPVAPKAESIGGGGGHHDLAPVTKGRPPQVAPEQIVPPKAPPTEAPKIAMAPTVVVQKNLNMATNDMPNIGMPSSNLKGISLGSGAGTGLGAGIGSGIGPGSGGNTGGGPMHIGGGVSKPVVLYSVEPEFSEEARKAKFSGNVEVYLWVDQNGKPSHIRVVRGVGMGLDEKAVEAVRQYKFKPAMKDGKPVMVDLYIDVNFQIF